MLQITLMHSSIRNENVSWLSITSMFVSHLNFFQVAIFVATFAMMSMRRENKSVRLSHLCGSLDFVMSVGCLNMQMDV